MPVQPALSGPGFEKRAMAPEKTKKEAKKHPLLALLDDMPATDETPKQSAPVFLGMPTARPLDRSDPPKLVRQGWSHSSWYHAPEGKQAPFEQAIDQDPKDAFKDIADYVLRANTASSLRETLPYVGYLSVHEGISPERRFYVATLFNTMVRTRGLGEDQPGLKKHAVPYVKVAAL